MQFRILENIAKEVELKWRFGSLITYYNKYSGVSINTFTVDIQFS